MQAKIKEIIQTTVRILTFRATPADIERFDKDYLLFGLLCTWLIGIGRSWDDRKAELLQHLGIGSVVYVFVLTFILWIIVNPLRPHRRLYLRILTFICLVSPPGIIYAIPVEKMFAPDIARNFNMAFLAIVAAWRVALWLYYLAKIEKLDWYEVVVVGLLPLSGLMALLAILRELDDTFRTMGGVRGAQKFTDPVAAAWHYLGVLSIWAFLPLFIAYLLLLARAAMKIGGNGPSWREM